MNPNQPNNPPLGPPSSRPPFVYPTGATMNGQSINPGDTYLFCSKTDAEVLLPMYRAAMLEQGITEDPANPLQLVDLTKSGYQQFQGPPGTDISVYGVTALLRGPGGSFLLNDFAAKAWQRLYQPDPAWGDRVGTPPGKLVIMLAALPPTAGVPGNGDAYAVYIGA